jgi:hypothetical protein
VKAATSAIPIVFEMGADPVASGLVASLDRPGGNLTGVISLNAQVGPKRLELLHELFAAATTFALLVPLNPAVNWPALEPASGLPELRKQPLLAGRLVAILTRHDSWQQGLQSLWKRGDERTLRGKVLSRD